MRIKFSPSASQPLCEILRGRLGVRLSEVSDASEEKRRRELSDVSDASEEKRSREPSESLPCDDRRDPFMFGSDRRREDSPAEK